MSAYYEIYVIKDNYYNNHQHFNNEKLLYSFIYILLIVRQGYLNEIKEELID
ncbi:hypothetical protein [Romboutsia sp. Marseille-P6047]|uniref:hypothetical protein n=1 Tax=Romboutsia sp. Marseille-P6047 TaxID=2161817 RepID=UPI0013DD9915|nr:hypothetical protein [Romboutsia sp. Marseille-P6047]